MQPPVTQPAPRNLHHSIILIVACAASLSLHAYPILKPRLFDDDFAIITDFDADRANTLIYDPKADKVIEPRPQEVAAMNVALALAHARVNTVSGDKRPLAIVVHDATSRRAWEVARAFGAKVFVVEVGEVNVLEKMRALEQEGYRVVIGIEGANGGTVFRGDDPVFQGDTSRNGAMTALFTAMLLVQPEIGRKWLSIRSASAPENVVRLPVPEGEAGPTLTDLLRSLPGEQGTGDWHFVSRMERIATQPGARGEVPEPMTLPFKRALEEIFFQRGWPALHEQGILLSDGTRVRFRTYSRVLHKETAEYIQQDLPGDGLERYGMGGSVIHLKAEDGTSADLWFRGSMTEGMLRAATEAQGRHAEEISRKLLDLFKQEWYPAALKQAQAGLEEAAGSETIPLWPEAGNTVIILTPQTALPGIGALSVIRGPSGEGVRLAVIVQDDRQMADVIAALEPTGLRLATPVLNMETAGLGLDQAIDRIEVEVMNKRVDFTTVVVRTYQELLDLGRLLVPEKSIQTWLEWLDRQGLGTQA